MSISVWCQMREKIFHLSLMNSCSESNCKKTVFQINFCFKDLYCIKIEKCFHLLDISLSIQLFLYSPSPCYTCLQFFS